MSDCQYASIQTNQYPGLTVIRRCHPVMCCVLEEEVEAGDQHRILADQVWGHFSRKLTYGQLWLAEIVFFVFFRCGCSWVSARVIFHTTPS